MALASRRKIGHWLIYVVYFVTKIYFHKHILSRLYHSVTI